MDDAAAPPLPFMPPGATSRQAAFLATRVSHMLAWRQNHDL